MESEQSTAEEGCDLTELPPGFRFHPTDEEIITHYLKPKVLDTSFVARAIGEADLNKHEPWDLPRRAKMGEKEWYFFCHKDRKYPTGTRTNRATAAGYWKATGKDREIRRGEGRVVGMKKTLVFYRGRAPRGHKSGWVMHEYRLEGNITPNPAAKDEWAVCRVFQKSGGSPAGSFKRAPPPAHPHGLPRMTSFGFAVDDRFLLSSSPPPPPLLDPPDSTAAPAGHRGSSWEDYLSFTEQRCNNSSSEEFPALIPAGNAAVFSAPRNPPPNPRFDFPSQATHPTHRCCDGAGDGVLFGGHLPPSLCLQSTVTASQETGLSADVNAEISSVVSRRSDDPHLPFEDLDCLWSY